MNAQPSLTKEKRQSIIEDHLRQFDKLKNIELLDEDQIADLDEGSIMVYASLCLNPANVYTLVYRWDYDANPDTRITMIYQHQVLTKDLNDTEAKMKECLESTISPLLACVEEDF